jgi:hypothetical protein
MSTFRISQSFGQSAVLRKYARTNSVNNAKKDEEINELETVTDGVTTIALDGTVITDDNANDIPSLHTGKSKNSKKKSGNVRISSLKSGSVAGGNKKPTKVTTNNNDNSSANRMSIVVNRYDERTADHM